MEKVDIEKINFAFKYASEKHSRQFRKGTTIPYIVHIYEVYQYLREEGADEKTLIAGLLHDVVEDTGTSLEEIEQIFGEDIAKLVGNETEDKTLPYLQRKALHMGALKNADERTKLVNCADKLSNLRSIYLDQKYYGEDSWKKFNGSKDDIKKYYTMAIDALSSLKDRRIYRQVETYFNLVFDGRFICYARDKKVESCTECPEKKVEGEIIKCGLTGKNIEKEEKAGVPETCPLIEL